MGGPSTLLFPALGKKATPKPNLRNRKSLNFQDTIAELKKSGSKKLKRSKLSGYWGGPGLNGGGFFTRMKKQTLTAVWVNSSTK